MIKKWYFVLFIFLSIILSGCEEDIIGEAFNDKEDVKIHYYRDELNENIEFDPCATEEVYPLESEDITKLIQDRQKVRDRMSLKKSSNLITGGVVFEDDEIIQIPIIFHNVYRDNEEYPRLSFCDYVSGTLKYRITYESSGDEIPEWMWIIEDPVNSSLDVVQSYYENTSENNHGICQERFEHVLEVLNEQYSDAGVEFIKHPEHPLFMDATDEGYNHIGGIIGTTTLKKHYKIPNVVNIYTSYCIASASPENGRECSLSTAGMSTWPWTSEANSQGILISHSGLLTNLDVNPTHINTLPHELGHYFGIKHLWGQPNPEFWGGDWNQQPEDYIGVELVSGQDCGIRGDMICDTPAIPGWVTGNAIDLTPLEEGEYYEAEKACIYTGMGGDYDVETGMLKIGGSEGFINHSNYGFQYNYDMEGEFYGTRGIPESCFNEDQTQYSTNCSVSEYDYLPITTNFMGYYPFASKCSQRGYSEYHSGEGFTEEQFANIRYFVEEYYTGCAVQNSSNYNSNILIDDGSCNYDTMSGVLGCMDSGACNYDVDANVSDDSCWFNVSGCSCDDGEGVVVDFCGVCGGNGSSCGGCMDSSALNYDSNATIDDTTCEYEINDEDDNNEDSSSSSSSSSSSTPPPAEETEEYEDEVVEDNTSLLMSNNEEEQIEENISFTYENISVELDNGELLENLFSINSSSEYSLDISASEGIIDLVIITNISETVLVGLSIPENYPPGIYEGVINVISSSGISTVPIKITVSEFVTPTSREKLIISGKNIIYTILFLVISIVVSYLFVKNKKKKKSSFKKA